MNNYFYIPSEEELMHSGILGMRWGVRRFQNPDGSLTEAGRKRYLNSDGSLTRKGKKASKKNYNVVYESEVKKEQIRRDAIDKGDLQYIAKNKDKYSMNEIQDAINRFDKNKLIDTKISEMNPQKVKNGFEKVEKMTKFLNKTADLVNAGNNAYSSITGFMKNFETKEEPKTLSRKEMDDLIKNPYGRNLSKVKNASSQMELINKLYKNYNSAHPKSKSEDSSKGNTEEKKKKKEQKKQDRKEVKAHNQEMRRRAVNELFGTNY